MRIRPHEVAMAALAVAVIATGGLVFAASPPTGSPTDTSRLVSIQHLPLPAPDMCAWPVDVDAAFSTQTVDASVNETEDALAAFRTGRPGAFLMTSLGAPNLLTSLHQGNLYAALQEIHRVLRILQAMPFPTA